MDFFANAAKELDQFGQDIPKHAGNAVKELDQFGQDIPKHAGNAVKELDQFGQDIPKHAGNIIEHVGKHVATTADDLRNALLEAGEKAGNYVGNVTETVKNIDWEGTAYGLKDWVVANPELAVAIAAAVVVPMISIAVVPPVLGALGWTASGVAAGSVAAGIQSGIGSVAAGSLFAILQSAAMGGAGAIIVNTIVGGTAAVVSAGVITPAMMAAVSKGKDSKAIKEE